MRSNLQDNHAQQLKLDSVVLGTTESALTGDLTFTHESPLFNAYDANGSDRILTLPDAIRGRVFIIANIGTANTLTVKDASANTIVIVRAGELQIIAGTSSSWAASPGVFGASGAGHSTGYVPDPGAVGATTAFLREDGLWVVPGGVPGSDSYNHFTDGVTTANAAGDDIFKVRSSSGKITVAVGSNDVTHGDNVNLSVNEAAVDHDALLNFLSNKHIDHTSVSISTAANSGLAGGGTIAATRTLSLDVGNLTVDTPVLTDSFSFYDTSGGDTNRATLATLNSILRHDALVDYFVDQHIDHSAVTIIAGVGLSGGGTINTSRTLNLSINGLTTGAIAGGDYLAFFDVSDSDHNKITIDDLSAILGSGGGSGSREQLSANRDYYVDGALGSDINDGLTALTAVASIQVLLNTISSDIDFNGYRITINIADGLSYAGIYLGVLFNAATTTGTLYFKGNTTTPANVRLGDNAVNIFAGSGFMACPQIGSIAVWINGVDLRPSHGSCLYADPANCLTGSWNVGNPDTPDGTIIFSGCGSGQPVVSGNYSDLNNLGGCNDVLIAGATLTSPSCLFAIILDSSVSMLNAFYTVTGSPTVSLGVIAVLEGRSKYSFVWDDSITGTVIGRKYYIDESIGPGSTLRVSGVAANMTGTLDGKITSGRLIETAGHTNVLKTKLEIQNSTSASSFNVYNTFTDLSNYERAVFDWTTSANVLTIGTAKAGTGSTRNLKFVVGGTLKADYGITGASQWYFYDSVKVQSGVNSTIFVATDDVSFALTSSGTISEGLRLSDNNVITWAPTQWWGSTDLELNRVSAGILGIHNASGAGSSGQIKLGALRLNAVTFANAVSSPAQGTLQAFTDSTTNTPGATITGGGSFRILGYYNNSNWVVDGPSAAEEVAIVFVIDGGTSVISTGVKGDISVPFACTITGVRVLLDQSGSIVVDIWKDTYANFPPVVGDSITASAKPTVTTTTKSEDTTLTGWTTSIAAGDTLRFNVDSITTAIKATITLKARRT